MAVVWKSIGKKDLRSSANLLLDEGIAVDGYSVIDCAHNFIWPHDS